MIDGEAGVVRPGWVAIVSSNLPLFFDHSIAIGLGLITSRLGLILGILLEVGLIIGGLAIYWFYRKRMARA